MNAGILYDRIAETIARAALIVPARKARWAALRDAAWRKFAYDAYRVGRLDAQAAINMGSIRPIAHICRQGCRSEPEIDRGHIGHTSLHLDLRCKECGTRWAVIDNEG